MIRTESRVSQEEQRGVARPEGLGLRGPCLPSWQCHGLHELSQLALARACCMGCMPCSPVGCCMGCMGGCMIMSCCTGCMGHCMGPLHELAARAAGGSPASSVGPNLGSRGPQAPSLIHAPPPGRDEHRRNILKILIFQMTYFEGAAVATRKQE